MSLSTLGWIILTGLFCGWTYRELRGKTRSNRKDSRFAALPDRVLLALIFSVAYTIGSSIVLVGVGLIGGLLALVMLSWFYPDVPTLLNKVASWPW